VEQTKILAISRWLVLALFSRGLFIWIWIWIYTMAFFCLNTINFFLSNNWKMSMDSKLIY
jgi:hypothetical protein